MTGRSRVDVKGEVPELDYFVGGWRAQAHNPGSGQTLQLDYLITPGLGGRWYLGEDLTRVQ